MIVPNFLSSNSYLFNIVIIVIIIVVVIIINIIILLPTYFFVIGRQSYRINYFSTFQSKIWSKFFFIQATLWRIENNKKAVYEVQLCLLHKLFRVKKGHRKSLYEK